MKNAPAMAGTFPTLIRWIWLPIAIAAGTYHAAPRN